jgi:hypothetical protein
LIGNKFNPIFTGGVFCLPLYLSNMKIIITEEQADTVKRIKVMERFIDQILSDYDWYEGIDKVSAEGFILSGNNKRTIPLYVFYVITNDDIGAYSDTERKINSISDEVDDMFLSLFPYERTGKPSAVWVFRFVRSENYGE